MGHKKKFGVLFLKGPQISHIWKAYRILKFRLNFDGFFSLNFLIELTVSSIMSRQQISSISYNIADKINRM